MTCCAHKDTLIERLRGALEVVVTTLRHAERAAPFDELPGEYRVDALEIGDKALILTDVEDITDPGGGEPQQIIEIDEGGKVTKRSMTKDERGEGE